jgi:hypothetical protein
MEYSEVFAIIKGLKSGVPLTIYKEKNAEIYLIRPNRSFKQYDPKKNFQIFIKEGKREFRPNHLRIFIDLHLRVRSRPELKKELLIAFDNIFYKKEPIASIKKIRKEIFEHELNSISIIAVLSQLFIIEQEFNYIGASKYEPPTLFYQGWIRQFIDSSREIDNLCMSVCSRQPPAAKYTSCENRKNKKWNENNPKLWYLIE